MCLELFEIKIYYDQNLNFYVEKTQTGKKKLPRFISMSISEKRTLADAYPNIGELIMTIQPGSRKAEEIVEPLIVEYNNECERSNITRWYKVSKDYKFALIEEPKKLNVLNFKQYAGPANREDIIEFIKEQEKELGKESYGVFQCPDCKKIQYQLIINRCVSCCGRQFSTDICEAIYTRRDGVTPRTAAINKFMELQEKSKTSKFVTDHLNLDGLYPFTYQDVVYHVSLQDCKLLHKVLYNDFACELIFEVKADGNIGFTDSYLKYLKSLANNNIFKNLYSDVRRIQIQINAQVNSIKTIERAFYWYINDYDLNEDQILVWKVDTNVYRFKTIDEYVHTFIFVEEEQKLQLMQLFNDLTCRENNMFYGYNSSDVSELSRLIYEDSNKFIYVSNDIIVDFGADFIDQLHMQDTLVSARNVFLESIIRNYKFWDDIKNEFAYSDRDYISSDETYYDRLCFYQYAITGKRVLKYKNLSIENSQIGLKKIKANICDAYSIADESSIKQFQALVELAKNENLCKRLDKLSPVTETITFNSDHTKEDITFETLRQKLVLAMNEMPSIELYLICSDLTGDKYKKLKVRFDGRMNTFNGHLRYIIENNQGKLLIDGLKAFYNDPDINFFIKYVLNRSNSGGLEKFNKDIDEEFNRLVAAISELMSQYSSLRGETLHAEIRGYGATNNNDIPHLQHGSKPDGSNTNSTQVQNMEQIRCETTLKSQHKNNKGDDGDEWS